MPDQAQYFLARVLKAGQVTPATLMSAVEAAPAVDHKKYRYTFTSISRDPQGRFIFARLSKFLSTGEVDVVDPAQHISAPETVPNLERTSSPFVYVPEFSAIAYQRIWNELEPPLFEIVFQKLVAAAFRNFFAECRLQAISDLHSFVTQLASMSRVTSIEASVHVPNPLYGALWESLNDYMKDRKAQRLRLKETAAHGEKLETDLPAMAEQTLTNGDRVVPPQQGSKSPIDAAVFMASDGYGSATVEGIREGSRVVVSTREVQVQFPVDKDPDADKLYRETRRLLVKMKDDRQQKH